VHALPQSFVEPGTGASAPCTGIARAKHCGHLTGRKSGFRAGFRPYTNIEDSKIYPPADFRLTGGPILLSSRLESRRNPAWKPISNPGALLCNMAGAASPPKLAFHLGPTFRSWPLASTMLSQPGISLPRRISAGFQSEASQPALRAALISGPPGFTHHLGYTGFANDFGATGFTNHRGNTGLVSHLGIPGLTNHLGITG
jgi:hypothetical protein